MNLTTKLVKECVLSGQKPRVGKRIACNACEDATRFVTHQVRMESPAVGTVAGLCTNQFDNSGQEAEHVEAKRKTFPLSRGAGRGHAVAYRPFNRKELNPDEAKHVCTMLVVMLGLSDVELGKIVFAFPQVIGQRLGTTEARLQSMKLLLNLSTAELKKVVLRAPRVLGLSFEDNVKPSLQSLRELLGFSDAELKKLVLWAPTVLGYSFEENVKPSLQSLRELLGLSDAELKKVVLGAPAVLGYSSEENVKPSLQSLRELLGLSDAELKKLVLGAPAVLGYSFEDNVEPKLNFLRVELELDAAELRGLVLREPSILGRGLDISLRPSVIFLREELSREGMQLRSEVLRRGLRVLKYSFCKRVQPRVDRARTVGVAASVVLRKVAYTDAEFDRWLARQCAIQE